MVSDAGSYAPVPSDLIARAPKVLLHDHLDGGMRPQTIVELAADCGYDGLPTTDAAALADWFEAAASSGSLERYLETFAHTVGVTQTADALRRVARECAQDLAADGVVYAEVRFAPELHIERGLDEHQIVEEVLAGFAEGQRLAAAAGHRIRIGALLTAMRTATHSRRIAELAVEYRDRGVVGLRHRRRRGRLPAHPAPGRLRVPAPRERPLHHPRRRGVRAAVDLGGAPVVRRRAARPRRADRRRHRDRRRRRAAPRAAGRLRARPPDSAGDVPVVQRADRCRRQHRAPPDRPAAPPRASASP